MSGLTTAQVDRAAGALLGLACGDALGAGYEFQPPRPSSQPVAMVGGGALGWEPGEWTDDTQMAVCIAAVTADGGDLRRTEGLDAVGAAFLGWYGSGATDVGNQTRAVLGRMAAGSTAADLAARAAQLHAETGHTAGNGSLMRTAPVALAFLHDPDGLTEAAAAVSGLTHHDPQAAEACVLWCHGIRTAVLEGTFRGVRDALARLPDPERAAFWSARLDEAEAQPAPSFRGNGFVVRALQAAWSAVTHTHVPEHRPADGSFACAHLPLALEAAVRAGDDTDTVAAIAGSLLGARWGASAVPVEWRRIVHGWPQLRARDLVRLAVLTARHGATDGAGWPSIPVMDYSSWPGAGTLARHPHDERLWLGGVDALRDPPDGVDAVVSLCRLGRREVPARGVAPVDHVEQWLVDGDESHNPNLDFVLHDAATAVQRLRAEGRTVLVHCVQAESRTPAVAALYDSLTAGRPVAESLAAVRAALPGAKVDPALVAAVLRAQH